MKLKNHWIFKLIALILVAVSAVTLALSSVCVYYNSRYRLYHQDLDTLMEDMTQSVLDDYTYKAAMAAAVEYVKELNTEEGTLERELWESNVNYTWHYRSFWPEYEYTVNQNGIRLSSTKDDTVSYAKTYTSTVYVENAIITDLGYSYKEFPEYDELPVNYQWTDYDGNQLPALNSSTQYYELIYAYDYADSYEFVGETVTEEVWDEDFNIMATIATMPAYYDDPTHVYRLEWLPERKFDVQIHLTESDMAVLNSQMDGVTILSVTSQYTRVDIVTLIASIAVLVLCVLYLCFAAGKKPGTDELRLRGTNRIPLDLFALITVCAISVPALLGFDQLQLMYYATDMASVAECAVLLCLYTLCLMLVTALFLMALCAQVRMKDGYWYKRTLISRSGKGIGGWLKKLWDTLSGKAKTTSDKVKNTGFFHKLYAMLRSAYHNLPLIWQWVLLYALVWGLNIWMSYVFRYARIFAVLITGLFGFPIVAYTAYGFGRLRSAAKRMSEGDLDTKIDTNKEELHGQFEEFANDLNALGDTCVEAAMEKMKSERMKTELITNVTHDIKTPLTSIINYVDLLQKAETQEERTEYLEVLDRQSQSLKKLIDDLLEMSKASSGNLPVELSQTDVVEAVNQALGEYADRMENKSLTVIFRQKEEEIMARCDGKLLWRVMSNILSNVVKYALPGTRVYVDLEKRGSKLLLSFKNISKESLNIPAEELMERFVRGDESRNDQGNGLGLNIAKSLMQAQGGDLELTVDGDLFKVTLILNEE